MLFYSRTYGTLVHFPLVTVMLDPPVFEVMVILKVPENFLALAFQSLMVKL